MACNPSRIIILVLLAGLSQLLIAQSDTTPVLTGQAEWIGELQENPPDEEEVAEEITLARTERVRLNQRREADYQQIPWLTPAQRKALLHYAHTYGDILSPAELIAIPGFDTLTIQKITPWLTFEPSSPLPAFTFGNLFRLSRSRLAGRFAQSYPAPAGYFHDGEDSGGAAGYPGNPHRYLLRFSWRYFNKIELTLTGEKDPGEQFFRGAQRQGLDEYCFSLSFHQFGWLKRLIIGSYRAGFGEGAVLGGTTGLLTGPSLSAEAFRAGGLRATGNGSDPFAFRGGSASIRVGPLEINPLYSFRKLDGRLTTGQTVSTILTDGYHRTPEEVSRKGNLTEHIAGANLTFYGTSFRAGVTGYYQHYSLAISPDEELYRKFQFRGTTNYACGIFFRWRSGRVYLFGEAARSKSGGMAGVAGFEWRIGPTGKLNLLYRSYSSNYQNRYARAFSRSSTTANEQGLFLSLSIPLLRWLDLRAMADLFRHPWYRYRVDSPSEGYEAALELEVHAASHWTAAVRVRRAVNQINLSDSELPFRLLTSTSLQSLSARTLWAPLSGWKFQTRLEWRNFDGADGGENGFLFQEVVTWQHDGSRVKASLMAAWFDTPGWNARISAYEPGLPGTFSAPVYSGNGLRCGLVIRGNLSRHLEISINAGLTRYSDRKVIGSGSDAVEGNLKGTVGLQIVVQQ